MDTLVLAAGRGSRLRGVAAPFHKPFMVVNGRPLIVGCVAAALKGASGRVIVIAAPDNVVPMVSLLRDVGFLPSRRVRVIVQPDPGGPGDAFLLGSEMVSTERTLILLADNVIDVADVQNLVTSAERLAIGTSRVHSIEEASRFTRISPNGDIRESKSVMEIERWDDGSFLVWVGPLVVPTQQTRNLLSSVDTNGDELKIGRYLSNLGIRPGLVPVSAYDVGVPNELEDTRA